MGSKYKITPFFRFLLAMIIIVPLAYFGASLYRGENPVENIQKSIDNKPSNNASQNDLIREQNKLIKQLESQIKEKDKEISKLKSR